MVRPLAKQHGPEPEHLYRPLVQQDSVLLHLLMRRVDLEASLPSLFDKF